MAIKSNRIMIRVDDDLLGRLHEAGDTILPGEVTPVPKIIRMATEIFLRENGFPRISRKKEEFDNIK